MAKIDITYHSLLEEILNNGYSYEDPNRKGVKRVEIPSYSFRHEFKDGFPAITTKKLNYKSVVTELIWFLRGDTNIKYLVDNGCNIWNKDAYNYYKNVINKNIETKYLLTASEFVNCINMSNSELKEFDEKSGITVVFNNYKLGDLGKVYGQYWRNLSRYTPTGSGHYKLEKYDQIVELIKGLKEKPLGTEHIVTARNPLDKNNQALPCCHYGFQIVVRPLNEGPGINPQRWNLTTGEVSKLSEYGFELHWNQRSVDTFLGLPFNIASYATLALIVEKLTGYKALAIQGDLKKVHLYDNSLDAVKEQLNREPNKYGKSEVLIEKIFESNNYTIEEYLNKLDITNIERFNYESYPGIKVEMLERNEK